MGKIIKTEFLKLKRYSVIKAGIIMTVLSPLLSLFYSTANGGQTWTFDYFMQQVMISNCTLFFPIIIALIAGYIITREYTDDTMKNISTIPISYKQLLSGKLLVLLLLTICFSFIGCVLALVINVIAGFPGVHFGNLLNMFIRVTGANLGIYISVLPIILLFCCSVNNFLGGVALAFVYGYFGTFEGTLLNYYPIKASMILVDPTCGAEVTAIYSENAEILKEVDGSIENCKTFESLLGKCDAVYLVSVPQQHEEQIRKAIDAGKHVLAESPIATNPEIVRELFESARQHQVILMESIKTAYATAYDRLLQIGRAHV